MVQDKCRGRLRGSDEKDVKEARTMMQIKQVFKRVGECNHCGECCRFFGLGKNLTRKEWSFIEFITGLSKATIIKRFQLSETDYCPHYDVEKKRCGIYEERPPWCREFPKHPEDINGIPQCGYKFQ
jgi:Fe-S-cluster containining protein